MAARFSIPFHLHYHTARPVHSKGIKNLLFISVIKEDQTLYTQAVLCSRVLGANDVRVMLKILVVVGVVRATRYAFLNVAGRTEETGNVKTTNN